MKNRIQNWIESMKINMQFVHASDVVTWIVLGLIVLGLVACLVIAIVSCFNGEADTAEKSLHLLPNGKGGFNVFAW